MVALVAGIGILVVEATNHISGTDLMISALVILDEACLELADASHVLPNAITSVQVDLLAILVARCARVAEVASHDLVARHHDIGALARAANLASIARHLRNVILL